MGMYYDRNGDELTLEQWAKLFEDGEGRRVGYDVINDRYLVSTVWLGLDHNMQRIFNPEARPLIFETMVFDLTGDQPSLDLEMERYSTEAAAQRGHVAMIAKVREWQDSGNSQP